MLIDRNEKKGFSKESLLLLRGLEEEIEGSGEKGGRLHEISSYFLSRVSAGNVCFFYSKSLQVKEQNISFLILFFNLQGLLSDR